MFTVCTEVCLFYPLEGTRFFPHKKSAQRAVITPLTPALYDGSLYFCLTPVTVPEWISRIYYVFSSRHGGTSQKTNSFWSQYIKLDSQVTVMKCDSMTHCALCAHVFRVLTQLLYLLYHLRNGTCLWVSTPVERFEVKELPVLSGWVPLWLVE